jgi:hypothetical protein
MAQQPLTPEQHELLSAWLDGELSQAERAVAEQLLQRDDAKAYLRGLEQTRMLVSTHAAAKAPATLLSKVMGEVKPQAKVHQLPTANWWTPLYAAAAAIIVAVAIMFGPALMSPSPAPPPEVARDALTKSKPSGTWGGEAPPEPAEPTLEKMGKGESLDSEDEAQAPLKKNAATGSPAEESKESDIKPRPESRRMAGEEVGRSKDADRGDEPGVSPPSAPMDQAKSKPAPTRDTRKQPEAEGGSAGDGDLAGRARGSKLGGGTPTPDAGDDNARRDEADKAVPERERLKEEGLVRVYDLHSREKLAAQNDALWLAALYGKAKLVDEGDATESIRVTLDTDRVPELMKALARLSDEQGYREATTAQAKAPAAEPAKKLYDSDAGLSGYLPTTPQTKDQYDESSTEMVIRSR